MHHSFGPAAQRAQEGPPTQIGGPPDRVLRIRRRDHGTVGPNTSVWCGDESEGLWSAAFARSGGPPISLAGPHGPAARPRAKEKQGRRQAAFGFFRECQNVVI